jgi:hypothetical protein
MGRLEKAMKDLMLATRKYTEGQSFEGFADVFVQKAQSDYNIKKGFAELLKNNATLVRTVQKDCRASGVMAEEKMLEMETPIDLKAGEKYLTIYSDKDERFDLFHIVKIGQTKKIEHPTI